MLKKIIIPLMVIGIAMVWLYQYLGGFDPLKFQVLSVQLHFQGQEYVGEYNNPETEKLFISARQAAINSETADLAIISYPSAKDSLHQIIGVISNKEIDLPNMKYTEEISGKFLEATITAHNLVMPKPNEVFEKAKVYASENSLSIDSQRSIDIYQGERSLRVLIPLID